MPAHNSYALLVGVGKRSDDAPSIAITAEDAARLSQELSRRCQFPAENISILREGGASRINILKQMDNLATQTKDKAADLVILFFSGHGLKKEDQAFLISYDTEKDDVDNTAVDGDTFVRKVNKINAKTVLILLNCCHSGAILTDGYAPAGIPFDKSEFIQKPNRAIITACTGIELAFVSTPLSVFTFALVEGLAGVPLKYSDKKSVTLFDLAMFIREEVVWLSQGKQHPELEVLQQAQTTNFEIVNYQNGIPPFTRDEFGGLYDESGTALNVLPRGVEEGRTTDQTYRKRFEWLGSMKNVIIDSNINVQGNAHVGDKIVGQANQNNENYDTKNAVIGSTITAGGDFRMGDDVISGNQQVNIVHNYFGSDKGTSKVPDTPSGDLKTELKALLAKEKVETVLERLLSLTEGIDKDQKQTVTLLSARFHRTNAQGDQGIISRSDADTERNKINASLSRLIDELE